MEISLVKLHIPSLCVKYSPSNKKDKNSITESLNSNLESDIQLLFIIAQKVCRLKIL